MFNASCSVRCVAGSPSVGVFGGGVVVFSCLFFVFVWFLGFVLLVWVLFCCCSAVVLLGWCGCVVWVVWVMGVLGVGSSAAWAAVTCTWGLWSWVSGGWFEAFLRVFEMLV